MHVRMQIHVCMMYVSARTHFDTARIPPHLNASVQGLTGCAVVGPGSIVRELCKMAPSGLENQRHEISARRI